MLAFDVYQFPLFMNLCKTTVSVHHCRLTGEGLRIPYRTVDRCSSWSPSARLTKTSETRFSGETDREWRHRYVPNATTTVVEIEWLLHPNLRRHDQTKTTTTAMLKDTPLFRDALASVRFSFIPQIMERFSEHVDIAQTMPLPFPSGKLSFEPSVRERTLLYYGWARWNVQLFFPPRAKRRTTTSDAFFIVWL